MECLEATGCEALRQEMESLFVMIAASNAVLELPIRMGMFNKRCYCVPPIYDEEQEDHEGLHQEVGCHDATTHDFCGQLVSRHDLALFYATPFQVVSHDADGSRQRVNSFDYIVAINVVMKLLIHMVRSSDGVIAFHQFMMKN